MHRNSYIQINKHKYKGSAVLWEQLFQSMQGQQSQLELGPVVSTTGQSLLRLSGRPSQLPLQ